MRTILNKCSFTCKYFPIALLIILPFIYFPMDSFINGEKHCIQYAKFIESDYKYDSNYGCYIKRNNIWISKSELQFR